jgi:hypothetical protein
MTSTSRSVIRQARDSAWARGDQTFTISTPCAAGHFGPRYASNGCCVACKEQHNTHRKPEAERKMRLASNDTRTVQFHIDPTTASLSAVSRKRFGEITGRPVSGSVIHKAAITLLASYLSRNVTASDLKALLR